MVEQGVATNVEPDNVDRAARHVLGLIDDRVVGVGRLHITAGEAQIAWVAVLPDYRRLGVGRAVMARLIELAEAADVRVILLNARAIGEFGAVSVVSGHVRGQTNTAPLHVEILYNEYSFAAAFAVASVLTILALVTVVARSVVERKAHARQGRDR